MPELEADEADEMYESDESDEAARWTRPRVASGQNLFRPRPTAQYVTQAQLETALARVGAQVRTNSAAIAQTGKRLGSTTDSVKKVKSNLQQTQQLAALMPLLT